MKAETFKIIHRSFFYLGLGALISLIFLFRPYADLDIFKPSLVRIGIFYVSLFLFFAGFFSRILYWLKTKDYEKDERVDTLHRGISLRQGIILSLAILVVLIMQGFRVLVWWDGLLAVGAIFLVEFYFLTR